MYTRDGLPFSRQLGKQRAEWANRSGALSVQILLRRVYPRLFSRENAKELYLFKGTVTKLNEYYTVKYLAVLRRHPRVNYEFASFDLPQILYIIVI